MSEPNSNPLLGIVRDRGLIDDLQLEEVTQEMSRTGKPAFLVLQEFGIIDLDSILQILADHLGTMSVTLDEEQMTPEVIAAIPAESARMYQCVPVSLFGDTLQVAFVDPLNPSVIDELGFAVKHQIQLVVADPAAVQKAIDKHYPANVVTGGYADLLKALGSDADLAHEVQEVDAGL